jgi:hypothetical protein
MKKLLLILLCLTLVYSCGDTQKNTTNSTENKNSKNDLFFIGKWESTSKSKNKESLTSEGNMFIVFNNDKSGSLPGFDDSRIDMIWDTISNTKNDYEVEYSFEWFKGKETRKVNIKYINDNSIMLYDDEDETNYIRK